MQVAKGRPGLAPIIFCPTYPHKIIKQVERAERHANASESARVTEYVALDFNAVAPVNVVLDIDRDGRVQLVKKIQTILRKILEASESGANEVRRKRPGAMYHFASS